MYWTQCKPAARLVCRAAVLVVALSTAPVASGAQQDSSAHHDSSASVAQLRLADSAKHQPQKTFFVKRDLVASVIAFAASVGVSAFDLRIANWARSEGVQGDSTRYDRVSTATRVNETPLTLAALATYGIGRLAHSKT